MWHQIIAVGNVGKDPASRYTPSGQRVTSFSVACNRQYVSNGQKVKETVWFTVTTWDKQAEACAQYLKKGSKVLVVGRMQPDKNTGGPRIWTKQDGSNGASFEVTAGTVRFLSSKGEDGIDVHPAAHSEGEPPEDMGGADELASDDVPF